MKLTSLDGVHIRQSDYEDDLAIGEWDNHEGLCLIDRKNTAGG